MVWTPDHIAIIDALSLRLTERQSRWAGWTGAFFAIGHGAVVTVIAVGVSLGASVLSLPAEFYAITGWVPVVLLLAMGLVNLRGLLGRGAYHQAGWALRWMPRRLLAVSHPLGVVLVGAAFAAIFDLLTQATAWGYIASDHGGTGAALLAGGAFTLGMVCTDTLDSQLLCRLLRNGSRETIQRRQRLLGWVIVGLSFSVVGYSLGRRLWPALEIDDRSYTLLGLLAVLALAGAVWCLRRPSLTHATEPHP